jgi:hypothetical protein
VKSQGHNGHFSISILLCIQCVLSQFNFYLCMSFLRFVCKCMCLCITDRTNRQNMYSYFSFFFILTIKFHFARHRSFLSNAKRCNSLVFLDHTKIQTLLLITFLFLYCCLFVNGFSSSFLSLSVCVRVCVYIRRQFKKRVVL